jgi:hypothetical protein
MEPVHTVEYELTSEMATDIRRALVRFELRRSWRRDVPVFVGAAVFAVAICWLALESLILPGVGGGLLCLVTLAVLGTVYRRHALSYGAAMTALIALHTTDRRVRIEFHEQRVRMETEYFRGEGAWTELDEIVVFPTFWALYLSNGGQIVIPGSLLSPELKAFLHAKAEQVMAPVLPG